MAVQLDGAGQIKLQTLDDAMGQLQRLHGIVEAYGGADDCAAAHEGRSAGASQPVEVQREIGRRIAGIAEAPFDPDRGHRTACPELGQRPVADQTTVRRQAR